MYKNFLQSILGLLPVFLLCASLKASYAVNLIKPIGKDNGYEEYSLSILEEYELDNYRQSGELDGISYLNKARMQANEMRTILGSQFVYGVGDNTNLFIEISYDIIEVDSLQEMQCTKKHIGRNFEKSKTESYQNLSARIQVYELFEKDNANFGYSYGAILPKISGNDTYTQTYALLVGAGYNKNILGDIEFEIRPTFGYYPKVKKFYFDNNISFIKRMKSLNMELNFDSFANEVKIRDLTYLSDLDDYLFGAIHPIVADMIREKVFPKRKALSFVDYNVISFKLSKKVFKESSAFLKFSHVLKNEYDFAKSSFTIGFFSNF